MWLLALLVVVPLVEIALFIQVGGLIGLWPTLGIVALTAIAGSAIIRRQGLQAMNRLRRSFEELRDPTEPLVHGAMILVAGVLLLSPGLFTDALGLALLVPQVRVMAFRWLRRKVTVRSFRSGTGAPGSRPGPQTTRPAPGLRPRPEVIEGDWEEVPPEKRPTHRPSNWTRH